MKWALTRNNKSILHGPISTPKLKVINRDIVSGFTATTLHHICCSHGERQAYTRTKIV